MDQESAVLNDMSSCLEMLQKLDSRMNSFESKDIKCTQKLKNMLSATIQVNEVGSESQREYLAAS